MNYVLHKRFNTYPGSQTAGPIGGIQTCSGSPTNPSAQTQELVSASHWALRPQFLPRHVSTHRPFSQVWDLDGHEVRAEHREEVQVPPGKGLPIMPSKQTQMGPSELTIHWALFPQIMPSHLLIHFPVFLSSVQPLLHRHQAACLSGMQIALSPQGNELKWKKTCGKKDKNWKRRRPVIKNFSKVDGLHVLVHEIRNLVPMCKLQINKNYVLYLQGLTQTLFSQASCPGQSLSSLHSVRPEPTQPVV